MLVLPSKYRGMFKEPFGLLFHDFSDVLLRFPGKVICTVGDVVTHSALAHGIIPAVCVIDGFTMRSLYCCTMLNFPNRVLRVKNPAGLITDELVSALNEAVKLPPCMIFVDGEEDLAVLPLIELLPDDVLVLYGQPNEGVVVCEVSSAIRKRVSDLLSYFVST